MLANLAEDVKLLRISMFRMIIHMLELDDDPSLYAFPMNIASETCTSARSNMIVFIIFLFTITKAAMNLH